MAHGCNLSSLGDWSGGITWAQESEVAVSHDHTTVLQLGQQSQDLVIFKKEKKKKTLIKKNSEIMTYKINNNYPFLFMYTLCQSTFHKYQCYDCAYKILSKL